uniref:RING-type domain-containing protein n=1 Tax=Amphimedon queenslandica TaxID=400682 RepID=A0A1X7SZ63_AMPQE
MEKFSKDELSFVEEVPKQIEIECPICLNILTNPRQVSCCGKNFCESCIGKEGVLGKWMGRRNRACPMCKELGYDSFIDKNLSRIINGLQVYCTNKPKGCQWKGNLKDLSTHLKKGKRYGDCQFEEVKCRYDKCQTKDQRQSLIDHEKDNCNQRTYRCEYCFTSHSFIFITGDHLKACPKYPTKCPNSCASSIMPRDSVPAHLTRCPLEPVDCVFSWAGCNDKPLRKDVHVHTADTKHMTLLAVACGQLKKENEQIKEEMKKIKNDKVKMAARMASFLGVINCDTYPILPVTVNRRSDPVHFYTEVGGHHMSAAFDSDRNICLAFHEGKFDKIHEIGYPKIYTQNPKDDTIMEEVSIDSYQKTEVDIFKLRHHGYSGFYHVQGVIKVDPSLLGSRQLTSITIVLNSHNKLLIKK